MAGSQREQITPTTIEWGDFVHGAPGTFGVVSFDAVVAEGHSRTALVTEHTVETGAAVVDHIRPNPQTLTLEVFISNVPIKTVGADRDVIPRTVELGTPGDGTFFEGGLGGIISGLGTRIGGATAFTRPDGSVGNPLGFSRGTPTEATFQVLDFTSEKDYVHDAFEIYTTLLNTGTLLKVLTPRANYDNMVFSAVNLRRDKGTGTSGFFTLDFKQIHIVSSSIVAAPLPSIVVASPDKPKGQLDPTKPPEKRSGILKKYLNDNVPGWLGGR